MIQTDVQALGIALANKQHHDFQSAVNVIRKSGDQFCVLPEIEERDEGQKPSVDKEEVQ